MNDWRVPKICQGSDTLKDIGYVIYVESYVIKTFVKILSAYGSGLRENKSKVVCSTTVIIHYSKMICITSKQQR